VIQPLPAFARRAPAWTVTALAGIAYLIAQPPSPDLAAASYRSDLFSRAGFSLWDNSWYGGHHLPAYSLLSPGLGALIGPRLLTALSMTAATALFALLIRERFATGAARLAALWFAVGTSVALLSSRVPFDLGLALGLAALVAAQRRRDKTALAASLLCGAASPVAAAFLALALVAWIAADAERRTQRVVMLALTALPVALCELAFPEGGTQPFVASAFWPALAGVLAIAVAVPRERRALRLGAALYALAMVLAYVTSTAVGGNVDRLGALCAGPLAACLLGARIESRGRRWLLIAIAPALLYWQANAPVADFASAVEDPAVEASYYRPLLAELRRLDIGYGRRPARIEVVATADHWEARWLAPAIPLARGWERQLDRYRNGLFYAGSDSPTIASYEAWIRAQGISYVAVPDAPLDYSAKREARVFNGLHPVWRSSHWRLFEVVHPTPLADPPAELTAMRTDSFTLQVPAPGSYTVLVHFTPYWRLSEGHGCVERAPGDWTRVRARGAGTLRVGVGFSLTRVFSRGARCS
jgi:hypothetical protein